MVQKGGELTGLQWGLAYGSLVSQAPPTPLGETPLPERCALPRSSQSILPEHWKRASNLELEALVHVSPGQRSVG